MKNIIYAALLVLSLCSVSLAAEKSKEGFTIVTSEQLKTLIESKPADLVVVERCI